MFKWKKEYEVGKKEVDDQHRKLFEIGNRAYELLRNDLYTDKYDKITTLIDELKDYTIYHFQSEEKYMMKIKYKGFFEHKLQHDGFIKKINDIDYDRIDEGQNDYIFELLDFVANWITNHILVMDKKISEYSKTLNKGQMD